MPKLHEKVLTILKKCGLEVDDETAEAVKKQISGLEAALTGETLGDGQVAIDEELLSGIKKDLTKQRRLRHEAEEETDRLKTSIETGESVLVKERDDLKSKFEKMEPLNTRLMKQQRDKWASLKESIPEGAKDYFKFAEEGKELDDDVVITNIEEHGKLVALKTPGFDTPVKKPPSIPKTPVKGLTGETDLSKMTPTQKMNYARELKNKEAAGGQS